MKTTQEWLSEVKASPEKLNHWLERQYVGESLAADRIKHLAESQREQKTQHTLLEIAKDEAKHRDWIGGLLESRGIPLPTPSIEGTRYWEPILNSLSTFEELTGAGHHAEAMRLVRIKALATDSEIAPDIQEVFLKILPDEQFHTRAFAHMSTPDAIESTRKLHQQGLEVLGLTL